MIVKYSTGKIDAVYPGKKDGDAKKKKDDKQKKIDVEKKKEEKKNVDN